MRASRPALRRRRGAVGALALASAVAAVLLPAPAHADSLLAQGEIFANSSSSGGTCSGTDGQTKGFDVVSSGSQKLSASVDGTVTDSGDAGDTTTWSSASRVKVSSRAGTDPSLAIAGTMSVSVDAAQDDASGCAVSASSGLDLQAYVVLDRSGWLDLTLVHPASTVAIIGITDGQTMQVLYEEFDQTTFSGSVWVGAGIYQMQVALQGTVDDDSTTPTLPSISGKVAVGATYRSAGAATATASGPGRTVLALGDGVNCTDQQVLGIFTKKAKGITSATFSVNGKVQRTVKDPSAGDAVVLKAAVPTSATKVQAVIQTAGKKLTVSRTYLACE